MPQKRFIPPERDPVGPIYDPSANVLDLVEAAVKRLDDLRSEGERRQNDLRSQAEKYSAEMLKVILDYQQQLREAESKRIDAIRAVDVNAVSVASGRAADAASVLAAQVQQSADALRSLVASSAATLAQQLTAALSEITKRLAELERSKYEGAGRSTVQDPAMAELVGEMRRMREAASQTTGKSEGVSSSWVLMMGIVTFIATLAGIGSLVYGFMKQ